MLASSVIGWATDPKSLLPSEASEFLIATGTVARDSADSSHERPLRPRRLSLGDSRRLAAPGRASQHGVTDVEQGRTLAMAAQDALGHPSEVHD